MQCTAPASGCDDAGARRADETVLPREERVARSATVVEVLRYLGMHARPEEIWPLGPEVLSEALRLDVRLQLGERVENAALALGTLTRRTVLLECKRSDGEGLRHLAEAQVG